MSLSLPIRPSPTATQSRQVSQWTRAAAAGAGHRRRRGIGDVPAGRVLARAGGALADAHFDVALAAAEWAVRIPPQAIGSPGGRVLPCVPLDQAREPIAIWLAILATHPPADELNAGLGVGITEVRNTWIAAWAYPGSATGGYLSPGGTAPTTTAVGYLLASAMTSLPAQKVTRILTASWSKWPNLHATDAQLAAALGIRMPHVSASAPRPAPGEPVQSAPQQPVCTS